VLDGGHQHADVFLAASDDDAVCAVLEYRHLRLLPPAAL
jgi:hypothetical protein